MAKLAVLIVLLIAVGVSAYRESSSCKMEMEKMLPMRHCMMWMQDRMRSGGAVANPQHGREHLEMCCSEIKEFSADCQCEAMEEMMKDMEMYGRMEMVEQMVRSLPTMCGGVSQCQFGRRDFA